MNDGGFPEQPGDDIDQLLKDMYGSKMDQPTPLVAKEAREQAQFFAGVEDEIAAWMAEQPVSFEVARDVILHKSTTGNNTLYTNHRPLVRGLGKGDASFYHSATPQIIGNNVVGVKTQYVLRVYLHTDEKNMVHAENVSDAEKKFLATHYFFDRDGNFGKRVYIPKSALSAEQRRQYLSYINIIPINSRNENTSGTWESRSMSAGDFELAGNVIMQLKGFIKPKEENAQAS